MVSKYEKIKSLLFDGDEQEAVNKSFSLNTSTNIDGLIGFKDFANHNFEDLRAVIGDDDFKTIVKNAGFNTDGGFLNLYQGSDRLRLYYYKKGNIVVVFAYGEFQPMRYKLYVEGIWVL
ncbi:hypothetical protein [Mucilaginibacter flavus]|uniref:hypothetical protein n=1 Tax=Mucilaginibacter flavus TaxID=931504 RepID=UPI0025B30B6B|nr:hypothetical protein [Mucilaginibacter flavus]MDN3583713.1 hypothetical protein [Mucilaginibacter flavus]